MTDNFLNLENNSKWLIYGDIPTILKILEKLETKIIKNIQNNIINDLLETNSKIHEDFQKIYSSLLSQISKKILGTYFFFENDDSLFYYYDFINEKNRLKAHNDSSAYKYKGEIKLENDEIVLDTLEIDANKYNI